MLRALWRTILLWFRPAPPPEEKPAPAPAPEPASEEAPVVTEIFSNRHERRQLERARRKYDKFVKPVTVVAKPARPLAAPKPRRKRVEVIVPAESVPDAEILIADSHHENRNDLVAYKETELYGEFNFRDTILQQLERYFVYLERMKKHDPDAYGYYRQLGATILPYLATNSSHRGIDEENDKEVKKYNTPLADYFNKTRPSFGCFVYGADPETERYEQQATKHEKGHVLWVPKFMYFKKYKKPPPEIQVISGGDIYTMTVYWDRPFEKKMKYGSPQEFGIFVSSDGKEVVALRHCDTKFVPVRSKKEHGRLYQRRHVGHFTVPARAWHIPGEFERWAHDNGDDCQHFLTEIFKQSIQRDERTHYSMTRVAATKGDVTAVFSVNIHRTAYFFQDRDVTLTDDGTRRRIFHFVRPHLRSDGTQVKAHFRGENQFGWAGYDIKITIPGRDHFDLADVDLGAVDEYWSSKDERYLDMPALGKKLKGWMEEGRGKRI